MTRAVSVVTDEFAPALRRELDVLVDGDLPDLLLWVRRYGDTGTTLVCKPALIWSHLRSSFVRRTDGSFHGELPLWTTDESPSDLCVEVEISCGGVVSLTDLHAL